MILTIYTGPKIKINNANPAHSYGSGVSGAVEQVEEVRQVMRTGSRRLLEIGRRGMLQEEAVTQVKQELTSTRQLSKKIVDRNKSTTRISKISKCSK